MYTIDYFINKFEAIPDSRWVTGSFENLGRHCANGHCGVSNENYMSPPCEALFLAEILSPLKKEYWIVIGDSPIFSVTVSINDGFTPEYQQPTPKQRILAALYDIKAMQAKQPEVIVKEKTVYVSVPISITEQAKELVTN